jgi:ABC-2 type transport system ATP-binding protein
MDCTDVIDVRRLSKRYGNVQALTDLTLQVRRGEIFGFLGPNGAGKTTSVKLLTGLARATGGTGTVLHFPLGDRRGRRRLGYLPELFRYHDWLSAREVLKFHARLSADSRAHADIPRVLDVVGLSRRADDRVGTYSKGMQQRLGLAVALLGQPDLVVLDEPTSALDPAGRLEVREILRDLRSRGAAVFLNSHLLTEVERVCDRIAIVRNGRVIAQGTIADVVGEQHLLRVRARANGTPIEPKLAAFGNVTPEGETFLVQGVAHERIPSLVAELVAANAEVFAVEPIGMTLEERFLQLTQGTGE